MNASPLAWLLAQYHWQLSLYAAIGIVAAGFIYNRLAMLVPVLHDARQLNKDNFRTKMERPSYAANHAWNRPWSGLYVVLIFAVILPFCLTLDPQPWWRMARDIVVILMFYDFFYYLTHRFVFHDSHFMARAVMGPLKWMHAVHHRQLNPCEKDSSYIHPLEVAVGLGLYAASIFILSRFMGNFHVVTIIVTFLAFTQINIHNHALWQVDRFPFKYLSYAAKLHHNHHARFTGGNFATITPLYDWMFGTLDHGTGYRNEVQPFRQTPATRP
jgi:sterol desaturase/sphingolipid hydroxylase (fatty acid hydroxylase superfamily)